MIVHLEVVVNVQIKHSEMKNGFGFYHTLVILQLD